VRQYWGTQRVARVCQVSPATVAHWIDQGHLPGHKTPTGRRRVEATDLVAFLRTHRMPVPPELGDHAGADGGRAALVLVEDDPSYRRLLLRHLAHADMGVDLVAAANGVDGLLEIGRVRPAVIVLDYRLPDLDASQVIERLVARGDDSGSVIVITMALPPGARAELERLGVATVIEKAEGMEMVVNAVRAALSRRAARGIQTF
jgi:CheY-like chemotaxis protein